MKTNSLLIAISLILSAGLAHAGDSPQFRGPNRDGIYPETGLLKQWPEGGPPVAWVAEGLGKGYASPSIAGDSIYVPGMVGEDEGVLTVLRLDGSLKEQIPYGKETLDKQAPGPRSTPTVDGNRLYLFSGLGVLNCFEIPDGKLLWQADTRARFGGEDPTWMYAESVLVDGNNVICTPGGPDASVAAFDKMSGDIVWTTKGFSDMASYCSADIIEHNGRRILLTMTATFVVGIDPATGKVLWTHEHKTDHDIHAVTPVYSNGFIYYTAGYGLGGGLLKLSADGTSISQVWKDETLDCQHHGVVLLDGHIYGTGHDSANELMCLEFMTGDIKWRTGDITIGVVVSADGMLYVYEGPKRGIVHLLKATPAGFERTGSFKVTQGTDKHWAHLVIAGKRLYVRHGDALIAYDIAAK